MKVSAPILVLSILAAVGLDGAQRTPAYPLPKGTNVILGRVTEMGTDSPVGGAVMTLTGSFDPSGKPARTFPTDVLSPLLTVPRNVLTTSDGYFFFRDLPAGKYSLGVAAFGFRRNDYPPQLIELVDSDKPTVVPLRVWKFGAISGTVTDERGESVVGIPVSALRRRVVGGTITLTREVTDTLTDDRGMYRLAQLPPGNYVVGVMSTPKAYPASVLAELEAATAGQTGLSPLALELMRGGVRRDPRGPIEGLRRGDSVLEQPGAPASFSPDGRMLSYANTLHPGTTVSADAAVITLGSGESRGGIDVPLRFVPTFRVSGIANGPNGPVKNLVVRLLPPSGADLTDSESAGVPQAVTNGNGAFTFYGVPSGLYTLKAAAYSDDASAPERGRGSSLWASQAVTVVDKDISGTSVVMKPGIKVTGRVVFKDAEGAPPWTARTPVSLRPFGAGSWMTLQGLVQPDGSFATPGDPAGRYIFNAYAPVGWNWIGMLRNGKPVADDVIELDAVDLSNIELIYSKRATLVAGSVVDEKGAPDPATDVVVFPADTTLWREGILNSRRVRSVHATSVAMFELAALPPGDYFIVAVGAHLMADWQDPVFLERLIRGASRITLAEGDEKTIALKTFSAREP